MASVKRRTKRKGDRTYKVGNWVACFSLPDGTRAQKTTKTKDKSKALQIAISAEQAANEKATAEAAKQIIYEVVERIHGKKVSDESVRDYLKRWQARKGVEVSGGTLARYDDILRSLETELGKEFMDGPLSAVVPQTLSVWRTALIGRLGASSVNSYVAIAKQAFNDAAEEGIIAKSPGSKLKKLKTSKHSVRRSFSQEEIQKLISCADGEWRGIILIGLYSAQRLSDVAAMEWSEIGKDGWWRVDTRKTEKHVAAPLAPPALLWLKSNDSKGKYVFPKSHALMEAAEGKTTRLSSQFRKIMVAAGLVEKRDHKKSSGLGRGGRRKVSEISFHSLRHTTTSLLKASGVSESVAMALVGHDSKEVNRQYTHLPESLLKEAMGRLPDFTKIVAFPAEMAATA
jgi:integrase